MKKGLIIIDMFVRDIKNRKDRNNLIKNQLTLIATFNKSKQPIILVGGRKDGKLCASSNPVMLRLWGNEESKNIEENKLIPELLNSDYDYYISKPEYSAFFRTKLEKICKKEHINEIYLCGISAGVCVYFTGADAAMRRILPILVTDASGSPNKECHKKNIINFREILGLTISTRDLIQNLKKKSR
jgi:isochorismate hydrolase